MLYNINFQTGKLEAKPIPTTEKNNLPVGTILHLHGYNEPDYVIVANLGLDEKYSYYGARYRCVNLDTFEESQHDAHGLYFPSDQARGIHTEITDRAIPPHEIPGILEKVKTTRLRKEEEKRQATIAEQQERDRLSKGFPYLVKRSDTNKSPWALGAQNIKTELARAFPGIKFSVKSESYSGGDSINVSWIDGPTDEEVKKITDKYQESDFNGMEDIKEYRHTTWPTIYGGADYVFENRDYAEETRILLVKELCRLCNCECSDPYYNVRIPGWDDRACDIVYRILRQQSIPAGHTITGLERTDVTCGPIEEFYHVVTKGPEAPKPTPTPPKPGKPTEHTPGHENAADKTPCATLTHNEKMQGLEIRFPSKPANTILDALKAHGWRWSKFSACWYVRESKEQEAFALSLLGPIPKDRPIPTVEPTPDQRLEAALALGFDSIEQMEKHQKWLNEQKAEREKIHANLAKATKLCKSADGLQKEIDRNFDPGISHQNPTARRARIAAGMWAHAEWLQKIQTGLRAIAERLESGMLPDSLYHVKGRDDVAELLRKKDESLLSIMGHAEPTEEQKRVRLIKEKETAILGMKFNDFFPTPNNIARQMVEDADIQPGMDVAEPEAGTGNIAAEIRAAGVEPDCFEVSHTLREILELKGFNLVGHDFLTDTNGKRYDRIIMNPPFSNGQDIEHLQHAYEMLKPSGQIQAIICEGAFFRNDKKAVAFREWLQEVDAYDEKLPSGTFQGAGLLAQTGVNARRVIINKG